MMTLRATFDAICQDLGGEVKRKWYGNIIHGLFSIDFQVLLFYRLTHYFYHKHNCSLITTILLFCQRLWYGCYIHPSAKLGMGIRFLHPIAIVIGHGAQIGNGVRIYQSVTIGSHGRPEDPQVKYPKIDDNVVLYANAVIVGGVHIGRNSVVGAGSVVLKDVPANVVVAGVPARILRQL